VPPTAAATAPILEGFGGAGWLRLRRVAAARDAVFLRAVAGAGRRLDVFRATVFLFFALPRLFDCFRVVFLANFPSRPAALCTGARLTPRDQDRQFCAPLVSIRRKSSASVDKWLREITNIAENMTIPAGTAPA
jgi:hypothetical protein